MAGAGLKFEELDAIGVTQGPALVGSLRVGITYGKTLAAALGKPLVPVNHLEGHVRAVFLEAFQKGQEPRMPAVCLIVSGGHTLLYEVKTAGESNGGAFVYRKLGGTRDDAAGEGFGQRVKIVWVWFTRRPIFCWVGAAGGRA